MISVEKAKTFDLWTTISTADFKSKSAKIGENFTGDSSGPETRKPLPEQGFDADCQNMSEVHPRGFEPLTFGSVVVKLNSGVKLQRPFESGIHGKNAFAFHRIVWHEIAKSSGK